MSVTSLKSLEHADFNLRPEPHHSKIGNPSPAMPVLDTFVNTNPTPPTGDRPGASYSPAQNITSAIFVNVSPTEEIWLKAHPLQPVASFDGYGTVEVKLYAPNMTAAQFLDNLTPYQTYKYSANVETCFSFSVEGIDGKPRHYQFTAVRNHGFYPTITKVHRDKDASGDGKVGMSWNMIPEAEAGELMKSAQFHAKLQEVMTSAGIKTPLADYLQEIEDNLGQVASVEGHQEFNENTKIHTYVQHVELSGWFARLVSNTFGSGPIVGAALKVAYRALGEPDYAGAKGAYGKSVVAMDGSTYQAGL